MQLDLTKMNIIWRHVAYQDCQACTEAKALLLERGFRFSTIECDKSMFGALLKLNGGNMNVPQFTIEGRHLGSLDELKEYLDQH